MGADCVINSADGTLFSYNANITALKPGFIIVRVEVAPLWEGDASKPGIVSAEAEITIL